MKKSIKVTIAVLAILIGVVTLIYYIPKQKHEEQFRLVDHVIEGDIAYHTDIIKVVDEAIKYNSEIEKSITYRVALSKLKDQLLNAGLKTDQVYFTYLYGEKEVTSIYAEIKDTSKFESAFKQLSSLFNLYPLSDSSHFYKSNNNRISAKKYSKYIKINIGKGAKLALSTKTLPPSLKFKELIQQENLGVINTTGTTQLDSTDYATFSYAYDRDLSLTIDWKVAKNHPAQINQKADNEIYPTQRSTVRSYVNIDLEQLISSINPFLKEKGNEYFDKLPATSKEVLKLWNGQASVQMGGKSAQETIQYITEFDNDFNQVQKKIIKIDSIPNLGFYWVTNQPKESLELLYKLPNVKLENDKLQIALLPALITRLDEKSIKASSQPFDYKKITFNQLLYVNIGIPGIIGEITIEKTSNKNLRFTILMKDWQGLRDPKKIEISSFW